MLEPWLPEEWSLRIGAESVGNVLPIDDLFEDAFSPISQSGAGDLAVGIRLQKTLQSLHRLGHPAFRAAAHQQSQLALKRARLALPLDEDFERLQALAVFN